jgi:hypothetical protein
MVHTKKFLVTKPSSPLIFKPPWPMSLHNYIVPSISSEVTQFQAAVLTQLGEVCSTAMATVV